MIRGRILNMFSYFIIEFKSDQILFLFTSWSSDSVSNYEFELIFYFSLRELLVVIFYDKSSEAMFPNKVSMCGRA